MTMNGFRILALVSALVLLSGCSAMQSFSKFLGQKSSYTEIFIEAEPSEVWAVITDTESFPGWNPAFVEVKGTYAEGAKIKNTFIEINKDEVKITSRVVVFDPPHHLNQYGGYNGIITFDHHYILEPVDGGTRVIQREDYTGAYVHFWDESGMEPTYNLVNVALRDEVMRRRLAQ